jgi:DNA repair exonuclease SbcCD ATPase subunit
MRRILLFTTIALLSAVIGHAQPHAYESKIDYQKTQQAAAAIDVPYPSDLVEDAVKDYLGKKGMKGSGQKGFTVYRGARLSDTASSLNDLYLKVERRDKTSSTIAVIPVMPSEDPAVRTDSSRPLPIDEARAFLNNLVPAIQAHDLEVHINDQQTSTKKSQKKYNNLQDDQADLEKKIRNTESDLDQNKKDQITASAAVQANLTGDQDALRKAQKQMNKLLDKQSGLEKKLRKYQADLAENKIDQTNQQADLMKQQQTLDTMKTRRVVQ